AIEEQFYLILPVIVWLLPTRALWTVIPLLAIGAPATRLVYVLTSTRWSSAAYVLLPSRADALLVGVIAALAMRSHEIRAFVDHRRRTIRTALLVTLLAVVGMALRRLTINSPEMVLYGYSVLAVFYAMVLVLAVTSRDGEIVGRVLRLRMLRWTGTL